MDNENKKPGLISERHDRFWTGLVLILVGAGLLVQKMGADLPDWLFTWPMILIVIGIITGLKHRFANASWLIMIGIGVFFLWDEMMIDTNLKPYFWPIIIIGVGLIFMLRPKKKWYSDRMKERWGRLDDDLHVGTGYETQSSEDVINSTSVFGGVKKVITSKDFKGGEIICFMGGAEYNLSQADITGPVSIEIIQVFGGTKLVVPPHWEIRTEAVAIFAGIEDKRPAQPGTFDPSKVLILKGTTVFGGIEIRSY
jgi:predicted membrane protein